MYGRAPFSNWEADMDVTHPQKNNSCLDFACQLMRHNPGKKFKVVIDL